MLDSQTEKREKSFRRKENVVPENRGFTDDDLRLPKTEIRFWFADVRFA